MLVAMLMEVLASAGLHLSQLSGIAKEVVIAGTLHVALPLDFTVAAIDLNAETAEALLHLME
jgi:hypothetical protein